MLRYWRTALAVIAGLMFVLTCYYGSERKVQTALAEVSAACSTGGYLTAANGDLYRCVYHGKR